MIATSKQFKIPDMWDIIMDKLSVEMFPADHYVGKYLHPVQPRDPDDDSGGEPEPYCEATGLM